MYDMMRAELESEWNAAYDDHAERWAGERLDAELEAQYAAEDAQHEAERDAAWWAAFDPSGELYAAYAAYWAAWSPWRSEAAGEWEGSDEPPF